jgi:hypothetical protein
MRVSAQAARPHGFDVAASYVLLNAIEYGNDYHEGWLMSVAGYPTGVLGVVGEIGGSYKKTISPLDAFELNSSFYNFMVGPRITSHRDRVVVPFGQLMFGRVRVGNNLGGYVTNVSWQPGAGVDIGLTRVLGIRFQGDYRLLPIEGLNLKQFRIAVGGVFRR